MTARFVGAAAAPGGEPPARLPEVALAGRSNVGKSSLLNRFLGQHGLARVSGTPGRTRQMNFFEVDGRWTLVDLPGYGFAVGPETERRSWGPLVEGYLRSRETLRGVVVIVDVRRGLETDEAELLAFLAAHGRRAAVVATKLDKLGRGAAKTALDALRADLDPALPLVGFSARSGEGKDGLRRIVEKWLA